MTPLIYSLVICSFFGLFGAFLTNGNRKLNGRFVLGLCLGFFLGPIGVIIAYFWAPTEAKHDQGQLEDLIALTKSKAKIGIHLKSGDGVTVTALSQGAPAELAGIKVGDRLVQIDGALCEGDYRSTALRLVGDLDSVVQLTIRRGNSVFDYSLVRR